MLIAIRAFAADSVSLEHIGGWGGYPHRVEQLDINGETYAVVSTGSCLNVFDLKDPVKPGIVSSVFAGDIISKIACAGTFAYVFVGEKLVVFDLSSPETPVRKGECVLADSCSIYDLKVLDGFAFLAGSSIAMQIVDVRDADNPVKASDYQTGRIGWGLVVSGGYAFVLVRFDVGSNFGYDLYVVDVSDKNNPVNKNKFRFRNHVKGIALSGSNIYVSNSDVKVLDISEPENPAFVGVCGTPWEPHEIAVSGDYAFVADFDSGLQVIDASDSSKPSIVGSCNMKERGLYVAMHISVINSHAYLWGSDELHVVNVSSPGSPVYAGVNNFKGDAFHVAVSGKHAFIASIDDGFVVLDVSNPGVPVEVGSLPVGGTAYHVALSGDTAFVSSQDSSVKIVKVSDPSNPAVINSIPLMTEAKFVYLKDQLVYTLCSAYDYGVGGWLGSFSIVDVSDVLKPELLGEYRIDGYLSSLSIIEEHAVISSGGVHIIDVKNPEKPVLVDTINSACLYIASHGSHAFLACAQYGFKIMDFSNPASPVLASEYNDLNPFSSMMGYTFVTYKDGIAYTVDMDNGLQIVDVSDPKNPEKLFTTHSRWHEAAAVSNNRLYLLINGSGMQIYKIKGLPTPITNEHMANNENRKLTVYYRNNFLYLNNVNSPAKLFIYDCSGRVVALLNPVSQKKTFKLPNLASGVYFIKLKTKTGAIRSRFIITR